MRREIETAPKDGTLVILEDDARRLYQVARWSAEQSGWVGENNSPLPIAPTHWLPLQRDDLLMPGGNEYLHTEEKSCGSPDRRIHDIVRLSSDHTEFDGPSAQEDVYAPRQAAPAINSPDVEPQTAASEPEPRAGNRFAFASLALAMIASSLVGMYFRGPIAAYLAQYADQPGSTVGRVVDRPFEQPMSVQEVQQADVLGRNRAVQLSDKSNASDAHEASSTPQTQLTRTNNATNEVARTKKDATTAALDLQRREEAEALASEFARVQRAVKPPATLSRQEGDEAVQLKQVAEMATAKLQQSLQQAQRDSAQTKESEPTKTRQNPDAQVAASRITSEEITQSKEVGTIPSNVLETSRGQMSDKSSRAAEHANAEPSQQERKPIWSRYINHELRIGVDLPKDVFVVDGGPTKTLDGRNFRTADGRADLSVYSIGKPAGETPKSFLRNRFQLPSLSVSYRHLKGRVLAVSGLRDDKIWYARCNFARVRVNCVALNYPAREKQSFDAIVTRISNTLSIPSDG